MSATYFYHFQRAGQKESEVCVEYTISDFIPAQTYGPAEDCYDSEGGEVEIVKAWLEPSGVVTEITDAESESLPDKIFSAHDFDEGFW